MTIRPSVRAVLLDGVAGKERLVLFRRTVPGRPLYWSAPGGHVEPEDGSPEAALHREMLEELGATVGSVTLLTTLTCRRPYGMQTQYVYGCRLLTLDPSLRCGPEFADPAHGVYEVVRLPLAAEEIRSLNLVPAELGAYLATTVSRLPHLIPA